MPFVVACGCPTLASMKANEIEIVNTQKSADAIFFDAMKRAVQNELQYRAMRRQLLTWP